MHRLARAALSAPKGSLAGLETLFFGKFALWGGGDDCEIRSGVVSSETPGPRGGVDGSVT